jgi:protein-disulfide isomerase
MAGARTVAAHGSGTLTMRTRFLIAALAAAAVILPVATNAQRQAGREGRGGEVRSDGPQARNWMETVERTPEGGFRMGNPNARVKLIEYLSLSCPHCAEFAHQGGRSLFQEYVRSGRVSVEYRNYTLNGFDLAAAFLSRCASPEQYFDMTHYLLGHQPEWLGRSQSLTEAQRNELRSATPLVAMQRLAPMLGLDRIASRHGLNPAAQRTCLANQAGLDQIERMVQAARSQHNVQGTPTFLINGQVVEANSWATIEPLLRGR